jgi:hypothetical protein
VSENVCILYIVEPGDLERSTVSGSSSSLPTLECMSLRIENAHRSTERDNFEYIGLFDIFLFPMIGGQVSVATWSVFIASSDTLG